MRLDALLLDRGYETLEKHGFYAEFHPDGQLKLFGRFVDGEPRGWVLHLDPERGRGHVVSREDHAEGDLGDWVVQWVQRIYEEASPAMACSFCGKGQAEVRKMIAGPTVYICDECIGLCNEILAEEASHGSV